MKTIRYKVPVKTPPKPASFGITTSGIEPQYGSSYRRWMLSSDVQREDPTENRGILGAYHDLVNI